MGKAVPNCYNPFAGQPDHKLVRPVGRYGFRERLEINGEGIWPSECANSLTQHHHPDYAATTRTTASETTQGQIDTETQASGTLVFPQSE